MEMMGVGGCGLKLILPASFEFVEPFFFSFRKGRAHFHLEYLRGYSLSKSFMFEAHVTAAVLARPSTFCLGDPVQASSGEPSAVVLHK